MINFMGYDEKKLTQIVDEWERRKWDTEMLTNKAAVPTKHIMTRAEAINLLRKHCLDLDNPEPIIDFYVAAGMLEIREPPCIQRLCSYESDELGLLQIEQWPEGIVVWIAGKIKYKSWEDVAK